MRPIMLIGLILVILGVLILGYQGVAYFTTQDTIARIGPVEINGPVDHPVPIAPILSGIALVGGVILLIIGASKTRARSG